MIEQPTGIIRTLPAIYANPDHIACKNYRGLINAMEAEPNAEHHWFLVLPSVPRKEFIHIYILINGEIAERFNFVGYREGGESRLWDGVTRKAAAYAILAGPVEFPPEPIQMRGFRGFRYTADLW